MAKRAIIWTKTANIQLEEILKYWVQRNKSNIYSKKLLKVITKRTTQPSESPYIGKLTDFEKTRTVSLGQFSIFYQITTEKIIITVFWDNRQNPEKLLQILQEKINKQQ